jgi:transcriptional regulator with XRE-family HTH domain
MNIALKQIRREFNLSQIELAQESGVSLPTIQNIESGQANPTIEVLEKITSVLGLQIQVHCPPFDLDRAVAFGVPLIGKKESAVIINPTTLKIEARKWIQQWMQGKLSERDEEAIASFFLAMKLHFPDYYQKSVVTPWLENKVKSKIADGRIIKLYRIALANVSLYL